MISKHCVCENIWLFNLNQVHRKVGAQKSLDTGQNEVKIVKNWSKQAKTVIFYYRLAEMISGDNFSENL